MSTGSLEMDCMYSDKLSLNLTELLYSYHYTVKPFVSATTPRVNSAMALTQAKPMRIPTLLFLVFLALAPCPVVLANDEVNLSIYNTSTVYHYVGCYNETTELPETAQKRALDGGIMESLPGNMTVPMCLDFCAKNTTMEYKFAGLEYSRECWCAPRLSTLSVKLQDKACDTQCDGDETVACGGSLKLSVYNLTADGVKNVGARVAGDVVRMRIMFFLLGVAGLVFALC
jgi:hypothetical protein